MKDPSDREVVGDRVTIYRRGKRGNYQADFHYRGQHRRKSLRTTNKRKAREQAILLAAQLLNRTLVVDENESLSPVARVTLATAWSEFLECKKTDRKRAKTRSKYDGILRKFVAFCEASDTKYVDAVHVRLVDAFRKQRSLQIGPTQMHHDGRSLKTFLAWCADRGMTRSNPLANQKYTRPTPKRKDRVLTLEQVNAILDEARPQLKPILAVLAFTGMRSGDARHLLSCDVQLHDGWIHVRSREGAESKVGNEWKVPVHPRLKAILEPRAKRQGGYYFTASASTRYPKGDHWINTKKLNEDFLRILKRLKIPAGRDGGFTVHDLRHFFKSFCLAHGVPREYVDAWQGHASVRSASDLYVHTFDGESQKLIQKVPFGNGKPAANAGESA
jgi:integrase